MTTLPLCSLAIGAQQRSRSPCDLSPASAHQRKRFAKLQREFQRVLAVNHAAVNWWESKAAAVYNLLCVSYGLYYEPNEGLYISTGSGQEDETRRLTRDPMQSRGALTLAGQSSGKWTLVLERQ